MMFKNANTETALRRRFISGEFPEISEAACAAVSVPL